jgi:iron complex outermembrane recepter protein
LGREVQAGFEQEKGAWHWSEYASLNNLTHLRYIGSVIVKESNARFFEPAPGRTHLIVIPAAYRESTDH